MPDVAYDNVSCMLHNVDGGQKNATTGAAEDARTDVDIDVVVPDMLLRIDTNAQHRVDDDGTRERA